MSAELIRVRLRRFPREPRRNVADTDRLYHPSSLLHVSSRLRIRWDGSFADGSPGGPLLLLQEAALSMGVRLTVGDKVEPSVDESSCCMATGHSRSSVWRAKTLPVPHLQ